MARIFALILLAAFFSPGMAAALSADEIVERMLEADKAQRERRESFSYTLETLREKLDADGKVVSRKSESHRMIGNEKLDYETRKAPEGMEGDLEKSSKEEPFELLSMIGHYRFSLDGEKTVKGQECHVVRYEPKPNQPFRNREEKVLNQVAGHFCVRKSDYTLMANEGVLQRPVAVAWFFATLRELSFTYEAALLPNGDFGPERITYQFFVRVPFVEIRERHERRMGDYRFR